MRKLLKQLVKFFGVTQIAWLLDLAVYTVLFQFSGVYYIISKAISYTCGAVLSYVLNRKFTFTGDNPIKRTVPRFIVVNAFSLSASLFSMHVFGNALHLDEWVCYFLSIAFSFSINYLGNKLWVFKEEKRNARKG